jgi:hypothetical protein
VIIYERSQDKGSFGMRRRSILGMLGMLPLIPGLTGCRPSYEWNQKLTVTVSTPDGDRSGSAVVNVIWYSGQLLGSSSSAESQIRGEATMVEVAPGRYLFAVMTSSGFPQTPELPMHVWADRIPSNPNVRDARFKFVRDLRETRDVPRQNYPQLVTFRDINDPASVQLVDPDDLASSFGSGYAVKSVTLEITDEDRTKNLISKKLRWLLAFHGLLDGTHYPDARIAAISNKLGSGAFLIGD